MNIQQKIDTSQLTRRERLEARISPELKMLIQYAADLQGSSLSEFLIRSAKDTADEVIREHQIIKFSAEDSLAFVEALSKPAKPNKYLKVAYRNYRKEVSSQP